MLALDDPLWSALHHAFGTAEDIPRLLSALATIEGERERAELWLGLWATLAQDGPGLSASYAAVPHVLAMSEGRAEEEKVQALHFAATVEMNRHLPGAASIHERVVEDYAAAIESLPRRVMELVDAPWPGDVARVLASVLLVGKRHPQLARVLLSSGDDT